MRRKVSVPPAYSSVCSSGFLTCLSFIYFPVIYLFSLSNRFLVAWTLLRLTACARAHTHTHTTDSPTHSLTRARTHTQHTLCEQRTNCCCRGLTLERLQMRAFPTMRMLRGSFCEVLLDAMLMAPKFFAILRYYNSIK